MIQNSIPAVIARVVVQLAATAAIVGLFVINAAGIDWRAALAFVAVAGLLGGGALALLLAFNVLADLFDPDDHARR